MNVIMKVIANSISTFVYVFLLLILMNYIYALLGMTLFNDKLEKSNH